MNITVQTHGLNSYATLHHVFPDLSQWACRTLMHSLYRWTSPSCGEVFYLASHIIVLISWPHIFVSSQINFQEDGAQMGFLIPCSYSMCASSLNAHTLCTSTLEGDLNWDKPSLHILLWWFWMQFFVPCYAMIIISECLCQYIYLKANIKKNNFFLIISARITKGKINADTNYISWLFIRQKVCCYWHVFA